MRKSNSSSDWLVGFRFILVLNSFFIDNKNLVIVHCASTPLQHFQVQILSTKMEAALLELLQQAREAGTKASQWERTESVLHHCRRQVGGQVRGRACLFWSFNRFTKYNCDHHCSRRRLLLAPTSTPSWTGSFGLPGDALSATTSAASDFG